MQFKRVAIATGRFLSELVLGPPETKANRHERKVAKSIDTNMPPTNLPVQQMSDAHLDFLLHFDKLAHEVRNALNVVYANISAAEDSSNKIGELRNEIQQCYMGQDDIFNLTRAQVSTQAFENLYAASELAKKFSLERAQILIKHRDVLPAKADDKEAKNCAIKAIRKNLNSAISHLEKFGRTGYVDLVGEPTSVRAGRQVKHLIEHISLTDIGKKLEIEVCDNSNRARVNIDKYRLERALYNLISNCMEAAVRAGRQDVKCTITIDHVDKESSVLEKDTIAITISDNGPGIPDDIVDKIFEPKCTTHVGVKDELGSINQGLGLSIVYETIKNANGEIYVTSKTGTGTEFLILLPRDTDSEFEEGEAFMRELLTSRINNEERKPHRGTSLRIAHIDDSSSMENVLNYHFQKGGHKYQYYPSSMTFLQYISKASPEEIPHLIITDMGLPFIPGIDMIDFLNDFGFRGIKYLVFSARNDSDIEQSLHSLDDIAEPEKVSGRSKSCEISKLIDFVNELAQQISSQTV